MNLMTKEKPYNTLNNYYRHMFGTKVFKVSLDGGFTCPNKDGTAGTGGCIFCSELGSGDFAGHKCEPLQVQFDMVKTRMHEKWPDAKYIAYFQANTNTYAPVDTLRSLFNESLTLDPNIVGLSIATRCDALDDTIYNLLEELKDRTHLQIELGLQSIHEHTARFINRGHDLDCFTKAVKELRKRNIHTVVHIINGFPNETKQDMLETIQYLNRLDIQGIKIHMLHVMRKTALGVYYEQKPFHLLSLEEYTDIVCDQIELLHPDIIVHRVTGDSPKELLIEPQWTLKKFIVMNEIDKELRQRNTHQGTHFLHQK